MKVADELAQWLVDRGIDVGFGIIGGGNVALWDAIARLGRTELVCCHHEQAATMAASYYARSSGRIGFALVTTGAGSSNALTGLIAAHMDGSPMIVVSGNEAARHMQAKTRVWGVQGYGSSEIAGHVAKEATRAMWPDHVRYHLDRLATRALTAPQGPVWLDIPKDVQGADV